MPPHLDVADVGTDHGRLALALAQAGPERAVHAIDRSASALTGARAALVHAPSARVQLHVGDGLSPLPPGAVQAVCIAGMGTRTLCGILERGRAHWSSLECLVLQSNDRAPELRQWLQAAGLPVVHEQIVWDRGRSYLVISCGPPSEPGLPLSEDDARISPGLRKNLDPAVTRWMAHEATRLRTAVATARAGGATVPDTLRRALDQVEACLTARSRP